MNNILLISGPLLLLSSCNSSSDKADPPNILFISIDDMADWVTALDGHPNVKTPVIDELISRGINFTNAHCTSPICGPSRAAILTGLRPETSGIYHNVGPDGTGLGTYDRYVPEAVAFPRYLREHGYHSMGAGKINHSYTKVVEENWDEYGPDVGIVGSPFTHEELLVENMDPTICIRRDNLNVTLPINRMSNIDRPNNLWSTFDWGPLDITDDDMPDGRIANWGVEQLGRDFDKPFFLGIGIYKPHLPWYAPREYFDLYDPDEIQLPPHRDGDLDDLSQTARDYALLAWTAGKHETVVEHDQWLPAVHAYLATISFVDAQVGKVLEALDNSPYAENTLIILFSDHGFHLGEKEHWGKHTPWQRSTRVPFVIVPPRNNLPEGFIPGTPVDVPVNLMDIYPTLVEMCGLPEKTGLDGKSLYPLIENPGIEWDEATVTTLGRGTHSIRTRQWRYIHYYDGTQELYDTDVDPNEWYNLACDPDYADVREHLSQFVIDDPNFRQFVRWGNWKAAIPYEGDMKLFDIYGPFGISEQNDVFAENQDVARKIFDYLEENNISDKNVLISE